MSLMIKFFCFVLVAGLAGMFVLKKPDGSTWLSADDFIPDTSAITSDVKTLLNKAKNASPTNDSAKENAQNDSGIYRWKDASGQWQYSDTAPVHQQAEAIHVSGNLNSDLVEKFTPPAPESTATPSADNGNSILPATLSPDKISTLIKDANNVQKLMDGRGDQLEKQLQQ
jgi:hypothetical protein